MEKYISRPENYKIDLFTTKNLDKKRQSGFKSVEPGPAEILTNLGRKEKREIKPSKSQKSIS